MNNKYHSFTSIFTNSKSYYINGVPALELEDDEVVIVLWADGSITRNRWNTRDRKSWREEA